MTPKVTNPAVATPQAAAKSQNAVGRELADRQRHRGRDTSCAVVEAGGPLAFSETAGSGILRRIHAKTSRAATPGTISTAIAGQSVPVMATTAATSSGPATAPAWSSALCTANPRPRPTAPAACASNAVLAGLRTAFPARSAKISRQATASPAPAKNGVIAKAGTQTAVTA